MKKSGGDSENIPLEQPGKALDQCKIDGGDIMQTLAQQLKREGKREGKREEKLNIARELVKNGVDMNIIASSTGLPLDKIEKLASVVQ